MESKSLYKVRAANVRRTWFIFSFFLVFVIAVGWGLSYAYDNPLILYGFAGFSVIGQLFSYWYSDKVVLKMAGAKPVTRKEYPDVWNITENLCISQGLPLPSLYVINDPVPNAFATGRNPENSAVAVTTGLLDIMERRELEGVIAHELGHVQNRDILLQTVVVVLIGFISIAADFFMRSSVFGGGSKEGRGGVVVIVGLVLAALSPLVGRMIQLAISRKREFLADASGSLMTRYPEGLASALEKLGQYSGKMKNAHDATAHLYISNPFGSKAAVGMHKLFMTHPPIAERVSVLRGADHLQH